MIDTVCVVGAGRLGRLVTASLAEREVDVRLTGRELETAGADLVYLCVPDRAIAEVASRVEPGPWLAHASGATCLAALEPHERRFSLHPLVSVSPSRGPAQLDGIWAAVTAADEEARAAALELAGVLGLHAFELGDEARPLYHAGAAIASNYLVTLHAAAASLFEAAGAPPAALEPLMRGAVESGFVLNGPIARGDQGTVEANLRAIRERRPELEPAYRVLAETTRKLVAW